MNWRKANITINYSNGEETNDLPVDPVLDYTEGLDAALEDAIVRDAGDRTWTSFVLVMVNNVDVEDLEIDEE